MPSKFVLCDHQCPKHKDCARYLEGLDRKNTNYIDPIPYKNGKCSFFEPFTEDDIIERVNKIILPKWN
jgi:hypothetical protein